MAFLNAFCKRKRWTVTAKALPGLLLFFLISSSFCYGQSGGIEKDPIVSKLSGAFTNGDVNPLAVNAVAVSSYTPEGELSSTITNIVSLSIKERTDQFPKTAFSATITVKIEFGNTAAYGSEKIQAFEVSYNPIEGTTYNARKYFSFEGAKFVRITVQNIATNGVNFSGIQHLLLLENEIRVTQFFDLAGNVTPVNLHTNAAATTADELGVQWNAWLPGQGVTHTQLEWAWVENETEDYYSEGGVFSTDRLFSLNSTRIDLPANITAYAIPKLYDADPDKGGGHIYYRIRAVNIKPNGSRADGAWSTPVPYAFAGHESTLNWQASTSFAEEGKRNTVIEYFDGSLRARQTVTKDNVTKTTITAETLYDGQGRPAIQILPVPGMNAAIRYQANLNIFNGQNLNQDPSELFDLQPLSGAYGATPALKDSSTSPGAARYYGESNPEKNSGFNKFIPDSKGFPYTLTQYTPDGTGRVMAQSGVGAFHKMGSGHETRYYYTSPAQEELDGLFGTEVGDASHYFKNMVRDANGQMSVSYVDMHGRTIATALAGKAPSSLDELPKASAEKITRNLLNERTNILRNNNSLESINSIAVPAEETLDFEYSIIPGRITIPPCEQGGQSTCFNFLYNLEISVTDESGEMATKKWTFNNVSSTLTDNCAAPPPSLVLEDGLNVTITGNKINFSALLPAGSYTVRKTLTINEASLQQYADLHATKAFCKTRESLIEEIFELIKGDCENPSAGSPAAACAECNAGLGTEAQFRTAYLTSLGITNTSATQSDELEAEIKTAFNNAKENCDLLCDVPSGHSLKTIRSMMLEDMKPITGQYAREWDPNTNTPPEGETGWNAPLYYQFDIFSTTNTGQPFYKKPREENGDTTKYKDSRGQPDSSIYSSGNALANLTKEEFSGLFKDTWANSLIYYHPEFRKLKFAEDSLTASYNWADEFAAVNDYAAAQAYYPAGAKRVPAMDPFYMLASPASTYLTTMTSKVTTANFLNTGGTNGWVSMWQLAYGQVKCRNLDSAALTRQCMLNAPVIPPYNNLDPGESEALWNAFSALYLNERRKDINKYIAAKAPVPESSALIAQKYRLHFPETDAMIAAQGNQAGGNGQDGGAWDWWPSTPGGPPVGVNPDPAAGPASNFQTQCDSYIQQWKMSLRPCIRSYTADSTLIETILTEITNGMKAVCIAGSDAANPYGSSNVPPGYSGPAPQSFEAVIHAVFSNHGIPKSALCNPYVIEWPKPYGKSPRMIQSLINEVDECACTNFSAVKAQAQTAGYNPDSLPSLNEYLQRRYEQTLTPALFAALQNCSTYTKLKCDVTVNVTASCYDPQPCQNVTGRSSEAPSAPPATCQEFEAMVAYYYDKYGANVIPDAQTVFTTEFNAWFNPSPAWTWTQIANLHQSLCNKPLLIAEQCLTQYTCTIPGCSMVFVPYQLAAPQPMPEFLKCGYTADRCITCSTLSAYTSNFKQYFGSPLNLAPAFEAGELTEQQVQSNILFAQYLNYHTGLQLSWTAYADAAAKASPFCDLAGYATNTSAHQTVVCASAAPLTEPPGGNLPFDPCGHTRDQAIALADEIWKERVKRLLQDFEASYRSQSLSSTIGEVFTVSYNNREYHYTLYYYDLAGSLVKTVPPAGVRPDFSVAYLNQVKAHRVTGTLNRRPHELVTVYSYNSLGQVVAQRSPDANSSQFWYDVLGRLAVSQNAEQAAAATPKYSYTLYDKLGRITEVGEKQQSIAMTQTISQQAASLENWIIHQSGSREDITNTVYDHAYGADVNPPVDILGELINQQNLRNRVSYSLKRAQAGDDANYQTGTFYTYDVHGNVDRLVQDYKAIAGMNSTDHDRFKLITYDYDLISGKVNRVSYQPDVYIASRNEQRITTDKFFHQYRYDAQNRLTEVLTSRDKLYWESDARYSYYKHGPLARTEYGQLRVQGVDYAYTLQGWLKGVNSTLVSTSEQVCPENAAIGAAVEITSRSQFGQPSVYRAQQSVGFLPGFQVSASDNFQVVIDPNSVECLPGSNPGALVKGDMGGDGDPFNFQNGNVAPDEFGFALNYFNGDYQAIHPQTGSFATGMHDLSPQSSDQMVTGAQLFNGNIASMMVSIPKLGISGNGSPGISTLLYGYRYDQLNRIVGMNAYRNDTNNTVEGTFAPMVMEDYRERISYDPNGNILNYHRNGTAAPRPFGQGSGGVKMDELSYKYLYARTNNTKGEYTPGVPVSDPLFSHLTNQLASVQDAVGDSNYTVDIDSQAAFNYEYDRIGNLIRDKQDGLRNIEWTVYGKIRKIEKDADKNFSTTNDVTVIEYVYDVAGNRVSKTVTPPAGGEVKTTVYVRDASGNVMGVYQKDGTAAIRLTETHLYGSSRLGMVTERAVPVTDEPITFNSQTAKLSTFTRNEKLFELSNHLRNVLVTVADRVLPYCPEDNPGVYCGTDGTGQPQLCPCSSSQYANFYKAEVKSATDYYPFGMQMVGRSYSSSVYRYGFNGKENDNEVKGEGNQQDYGMRISDPRLGRFLSVDPLTKDYPWYTPYQFAGNMPIAAVDLDGEEPSMRTMAEAAARQAMLKVESDHRQANIDFYDPIIIAEDIYNNTRTGRMSKILPEVKRVEIEYTRAIGENVSGGFFGSFGYIFWGDKGAIVGGVVDQASGAVVALKPSNSTSTKPTVRDRTYKQVAQANGAGVPEAPAVQERRTTIYANNAKKLQVGEYGPMTKANAKSGLSADHIPSYAAVKSFTEQNLGRKLTPLEAAELRKTTLTIVYETTIHEKTSRTFAGRNNPVQIAMDAANLGEAVLKDINALTPELLRSGYSQSDINAAQKQLAERYSPN
jgi:RHS repeat-associated protein